MVAYFLFDLSTRVIVILDAARLSASVAALFAALAAFFVASFSARFCAETDSSVRLEVRSMVHQDLSHGMVSRLTSKVYSFMEVGMVFLEPFLALWDGAAVFTILSR